MRHFVALALATLLHWRRRLQVLFTETFECVSSHDADVLANAWHRFELQEAHASFDTMHPLGVLFCIASSVIAVMTCSRGLTDMLGVYVGLLIVHVLIMFLRSLRFTWIKHDEREMSRLWAIIQYAMMSSCHCAALMMCMINDELVAHRSFCLTFAYITSLSVAAVRLSTKAHVFVSAQSGVVWLAFHWIMDFLRPIPIFLGFAIPAFELIASAVYRKVRWKSFCLSDKEKCARLHSEALMKTLRGVLNSTFDASCECDGTGRILCLSPHFKQLLGSHSCDLGESNLVNLAVNPMEAQRIETFLRQTSCQKQELASLLETALRCRGSRLDHKDNSWKVKLRCVVLPTECTALGAPAIGVVSPQTQKLFVGIQEVQPLDVMPLDSSSSALMLVQSSAHVQSQLALGSRSSSECDKGLGDEAHNTVNVTSLKEATSEIDSHQSHLDFDVLSLSSLAYTAGHSVDKGMSSARDLVAVATQIESDLLILQGVSVACQTQLACARPPRLPIDLAHLRPSPHLAYQRLPHLHRDLRSRSNSSSASSSTSTSAESVSLSGSSFGTCTASQSSAASDVEILVGARDEQSLWDLSLDGQSEGSVMPSGVSLRAYISLPRDEDGQLTSFGSLHHKEGQKLKKCRPCAFHWKSRGSCLAGALCYLCHADHGPVPVPHVRSRRSNLRHRKAYLIKSALDTLESKQELDRDRG